MSASGTTFADLDRAGFEIEVTCQKCGQRAVIDARSRPVRDLPVAGRRFRCTQPACGGVGLPTIGKQRAWVAKLSEHAQRLHNEGPKKPRTGP